MLRHPVDDGRGMLERATAAGTVIRAGRSLYGLPEVDAAERLARGVGGLLCLTSAALAHRWEVKTVPDRPHILVPRGRRLPSDLVPRAAWHRGAWTPDDVSAGFVTS